MRKIIKTLMFVALVPILLFSKTVNLDQEIVKVELKNNSLNLLTFPFVIQEAKLSSETPENYSITSKNTSLAILPNSTIPEENADLLIWSAMGDAYLIKINSNGKDQQIVFSSNKVEKNAPVEAKKFETGQIEKDVKRLVKLAVLDNGVPGYKKVDVKRIFETPDLTMQKEKFYDGGKYRVESWFLSNKTNDILSLDYENFYTNGILSIAFEKRKLEPGQVGKMWLIVNKSTISDKINKDR